MGLILLARHGQASFGLADYDQLSLCGTRQSQILGRHLARRGVRPDTVVCGSMKRQVETAAACVTSGGWAVTTVQDPAWNEFNHHELVGAATGDRADFQRRLEAAMRRWSEPGTAAACGERFSEFTSRTVDALQRIATDGRDATTLVFTSAGVIGWIANSLLGGRTEQWIKLNRVLVNTSITTLVVGREAVSLVGFNDHGHLALAEITYR